MVIYLCTKERKNNGTVCWLKINRGIEIQLFSNHYLFDFLRVRVAGWFRKKMGATSASRNITRIFCITDSLHGWMDGCRFLGGDGFFWNEMLIKREKNFEFAGMPLNKKAFFSPLLISHGSVPFVFLEVYICL